MKRFFFAVCIIISWPGYCNIGDNILPVYKQNFNKLTPVKQEHFALRMYTITGDKQYLAPIKSYIILLSAQLNYLLDNLCNEQFIKLENSILIKTSPLDTEKKIQRMQAIAQTPTLAFDLNLLVLLYKMHFYDLEKTLLIKNPDRGKAYIKSKIPKITKFILNEYNIQIYGAQLINFVYYLIELDIVNIKKPYTKLFKHTFPDNKDKNLSNELFSSKIYGLTHFILAASNYYKSYPEPSQFDWIVKYFDKNIDQIILRTENDIIVEVGVCYLLLGKSHLDSFKKIRTYLLNAFDHKYHLLPNKNLSYDLLRGEHRNILTIMFFKWPKNISSLPPMFNKHDQLTPNIPKYNFNLIA